MEPESSLQHSQKAAICPYPEQDQSSPCPSFPLLVHYIHFNIILGFLSSLTSDYKTNIFFLIYHKY